MLEEGSDSEPVACSFKPVCVCHSFPGSLLAAHESWLLRFGTCNLEHRCLEQLLLNACVSGGEAEF